MPKVLAALYALLIFVPIATSAAVDDGKETSPDGYRGWDYLVGRLKTYGLEEDTLKEIYQDPRMPWAGPIPFSLKPKEHASIYSGFLSKDKIATARKFIQTNSEPLARAHTTYAVTPTVVTAILFIESQFGANTGKELILNRLSRLAALGSPQNISFNYARLHKDDPTVTEEGLAARARYLEDTFTPEIPAVLAVARLSKTHPLEIRGSYAGAFGIPQFLPTSFLRYGVDGNKDGKISLFDPVDAIFSTAYFLKSSGWSDSLPPLEKRKVIWRYNKSEEYITTVLRFSERLQARPGVAKPRDKVIPVPQ